MEQLEQTTKTYKSAKDYEKDARKMQKDGWRVVNSNTFQPRSGIGRIVMTGGIGAIAFKPKPSITVIYERPRQ